MWLYFLHTWKHGRLLAGWRRTKRSSRVKSCNLSLSGAFITPLFCCSSHHETLSSLFSQGKFPRRRSLFIMQLIPFVSPGFMFYGGFKILRLQPLFSLQVSWYPRRQQRVIPGYFSLISSWKDKTVLQLLACIARNKKLFFFFLELLLYPWTLGRWI